MLTSMLSDMTMVKIPMDSSDFFKKATDAFGTVIKACGNDVLNSRHLTLSSFYESVADGNRIVRTTSSPERFELYYFSKQDSEIYRFSIIKHKDGIIIDIVSDVGIETDEFAYDLFKKVISNFIELEADED